MLASHLSAETIVRSVEIRGNHALSERELLGAIILKPSFAFSASQLHNDLDRILDLYYQNGYYLVSALVDSLGYSADSSSVGVWIHVEEGEQAHVGTIRLEGNTAYTVDEVLGECDTRPGRVFQPSVLERDVDNVIHRYERNGYPFAKVTITGMTSRSDSTGMLLDIDIQIDEGMLVRVNEIRVEGNKDTRASVVVRETRLRPGEPYDEDKIRTIPERLARLNIFANVGEPELYVNAKGGGLLLKVQEGATNTFDGVVGYVPGGGGEGGFLTGLVNVGMRNLFGTGRKMNVHWQREDRLSQELSFRYLEPWVADLPINLSGSFYQRQQDTTYVNRTVELKTDLLPTENLSFGAFYNHGVVIPSTTLATAVVSNSSTITVGLEVQYNSRNDLVSPTGGVLYRSDYSVGRKKIFGTAASSVPSISVQKISLDFEWYVGLFARQIFVPGLHGRELQSGQVEISDLYRFGGANTLRGYRENQFLGSRIVWSNVEYRFLLARRSFFFGFFDTGYYLQPGDDAKSVPSNQGLKYGYGAGVRVETSLGNIGVSFALGEGDSFSQGKIHFGLINEF